MAERITTGWVLPPRTIGGQDHLAVRAISEAIYGELAPCVTNGTDRIILYAFYPWFTWTFSKRFPDASYDEFKQRFRQAECLLTMIGARHEIQASEVPAASHGEGLPGRRKLLSLVHDLEDGTLRLSDYAHTDSTPTRYFKAPLGGFDQYYRGVLQTLDIMGGGQASGIRVSPGRGVRLAQSFNAHVPGDLFWGVLLGDEVSAEHLDELAEFCPCHLQHRLDLRDILVDILLNRDGCQDMPDMRDTLALVCDFLAEREAGDESWRSLVWELRERAYGGCVASEERTNAALPMWAAYHRHELLAFAVQSLLWAILRRVELSNDAGHLPALHSSGDVARWFLEQEEPNLGELTLDVRFSEFVTTVTETLPSLSDIREVTHELRIADALQYEEDVAGAVVKSIQLLAALVSRFSNDPPYGGFTREESYFRDYPLNLRSLRSLSRGRWADLTVREWLLWLLTHWGVGQHLRVALRKLHAQGVDTFRLRPTEQGLLPVENLEVVYTGPRLFQTLRALHDLGFIDDNHRLTESGLALREELHG